MATESQTAPLDVKDLPLLYESWRSRWRERDDRIEAITKVLKGDTSSVVNKYDETPIKSRSPNMIQVALEDTSEAAALVPTIRTDPTALTQRAKEVAAAMERIGTSYLDANSIDLEIPRIISDLASCGVQVLTVTPDQDQKIPLIERRDPRTCYPEPGFRAGDTVRRVLFAREVYYSQLPREYQLKFDYAESPDGLASIDLVPDPNMKVVLVEWYDENEIVVAGLYEGNQASPLGRGSAEVPWLPIELDRIEHGIGVCPVVVDQRITFDGEPRGQFDQVIGIYEGLVELFSLMMDYSDQAVYSDIWVRDLIGELPFGGGAYIELGPNGQIGRVPPAQSGLDAPRNIMQLIDGLHLGARWPKTRPGDVDQAIASAKFVEATAGMMNTAIRTYHLIVRRILTRALTLSFLVDKKFFPGKKTTSGVLRNQQFVLEYDPSKDIDLSTKVRVEYGLGLGRDPAQSAVLHIQYEGSGFIPKSLVRENLDGVSDVAKLEADIDVETFQEIVKAKLAEGIQTGTIPGSAIVEMARARERGDSLFDLYDKYVVKPQEEMQSQMVNTGLGDPMMPGAAPPPPGPGGTVPAPTGADLLARINVPAGPGGMMGTQVMG